VKYNKKHKHVTMSLCKVILVLFK